MERMSKGAVASAWEALDKVPNLPAYAERAIRRLRQEMETALEQEAKYRCAVSDVRTAMEGVDPWDGAPWL